MLQGKLKEKDINLLEACKKKKEPSKYEEAMKYAIPPIVIVLLFGSIFGYFKWQQMQLQNETEEVNAQIAKIEKEQNADGKEMKLQELQDLNTEYTNIQNLYAMMNSYPQLSKEVIDGIFRATGTYLDILSFNYTQESAVLSLSVRTPFISQTDAVIRRLKETGLFADVQYSGFTSEDMVAEVTTPQESEQTGEDILTMTDKELREYIAKLQNGEASQPTKQESDTVIGKAYNITISCILKSVVNEE